MHIASALGVPTVAVFGATDDQTTGPTGLLAKVVREPVECSPCLKRECPIDHRCMTRVDASRVAEAALELLERDLLK
jgi:heptosyltransferase-2